MDRQIETAVLLMAYGAARSLDEIPAYLADIRGGRPPSPELVAEVRHRYGLLGGGSPLFAISEAQAEGLRRVLAARGLSARVAVGMRHSEPFIGRVAAGLAAEGVRRLVGLPLTPFQSSLSVGAYFKKLDEAAASCGLSILRSGDWHANANLVEAYAQRIREALSRLGPDFKGKTALLLTAHSLPQRILAAGDPYPAQLQETAGLVAKAVGFAEFRFAYQSRGATPEPWLGPDAAEALEAIAKAGFKAVVLAPIGFVSDHMETLYDDDILYKGRAEALALRFERAGALNDHPLFAEALADVVQAALSGAAA
ncbi:MAG: ferrochelatase [Elusimicrobia bacterium]|nr:ferrochelatase [Elusimicrobiota bacterium]